MLLWAAVPIRRDLLRCKRSSRPDRWSPGPAKGQWSLARVFSRGTSNATALGTRCAARLRAFAGTEGAPEATNSMKGIPVIIKALLVHGASWGSRSERNRDKPEQHRHRLASDPTVAGAGFSAMVKWTRRERWYRRINGPPSSAGEVGKGESPCIRRSASPLPKLQQAEAAAHRDTGLAVADQQPTQKLPPGPIMVPCERERNRRQQNSIWIPIPLAAGPSSTEYSRVKRSAGLSRTRSCPSRLAARMAPGSALTRFLTPWL